MPHLFLPVQVITHNTNYKALCEKYLATNSPDKTLNSS